MEKGANQKEVKAKSRLWRNKSKFKGTSVHENSSATLKSRDENQYVVKGKENLHAKGVVKELLRKVSHDTRVEIKGGQAKQRAWNNTRRPVISKARDVNE